MRPAEGVAQAVALWGGRVLATGSDAEIAPLIGPDTRVIDLRGRLATPGLIDAHLHLLPYGLGMLQVDARPKNAPTLDALLGLIKARAEALGPGKWVLARGYDQFKLDVKRHPWREELDRVAPDNPVHLVRTCGHISICNSKAFELAGITAATVAPPGGLIEVQNGQLTGMLAENGRDPIRKVLPAATDEELVGAIERAGQYLNSLGITSCMDAAVGMHSHFREIGAYFSAERSGRLPVRTSMCLLGDPGPKSIVPDCHRAGLVTGAGHDMLRVGPVKIFTDGSAGGRTAWMSQPYLGDDKTLGVSCQTDAVLDEYVLDYHRKGYQMAFHAIGDAAIEQVLRAYEKALAAMPDPDRRHRIEHCGFLTDDHIARMQAAGVYPAPQPVFIYDFGDLYYSVLGSGRPEASYPMRGWFNADLKPSASTDAPVCDANPFPNIYAMLTRKTHKGTVVGGQQALDHRRDAAGLHRIRRVRREGRDAQGPARAGPARRRRGVLARHDEGDAGGNSRGHVLRPHDPRRRGRVRPARRDALMGQHIATTTVIRNSDWIVAHEGGVGHVYRTGDVAFTGDALTHVGGPYTGAADREIDGRGFMVMPGLVNIHSHPASEPLNKGWNDEIGSPKLYNSSLYEIMPIFRPDAEGVKAAFRVALCEALMSGVTTLVDLSVAHDGWVDLMAESGIRGVLGPMYRDARWYTKNGYRGGIRVGRGRRTPRLGRPRSASSRRRSGIRAGASPAW